MGKYFHYEKPRYLAKFEADYVSRCDIENVLIAERDLRAQVQLEERLHQKVTALRKATVIEGDRTQLEEAIQQLEDAQKLRPAKEYTLYRRETQLVPGLKSFYDELRYDSTWFMREGLVQDCSAQGGCCSRQCGCCAQRHSSGVKIGGHCTVECGCCMDFRGFDLPDTEKGERSKDFNSCIRSASQHFLDMANGFFSPLMPVRISRRHPRLRIILRPLYHDEKVL